MPLTSPYGRTMKSVVRGVTLWCVSCAGEVSDVVMRQPGKKKSKGSAFVEMGTMEAAASAARAQNGSPDAPLLVVPFNKVIASTRRDTKDLQSPHLATYKGPRISCSRNVRGSISPGSMALRADCADGKIQCRHAIRSSIPGQGKECICDHTRG